MSDSSGIIEIKNNINKKENGEFDKSTQSFKDSNRFDIGIKMLKNQREKITNAGKYNERYKNTFAYPPTDKKEFPLSMRYRDINGRLILKRNSLSNQGSSDNSVDSDHSKTDSTPNASPKFEKPVTLTSILNNSTDTKKVISGKNSNATQDLNKAGNVSQLTKFRLVSDIKKPNTSNELGSTKSNKSSKKEQDINIYSIQPVQTELPKSVGVNLVFDAPKDLQIKPIDTMDTLQNVQKYISQIEAEEARRKNMQKFNELCKNLKPDTKSEQKDKSQEIVNEKKPQEHILVPLKTSNEVENLLKPGVSDMDVEGTEPFERTDKKRSSVSGTEYNDKNKGKPLSRASSDVQGHKIPDHVVKAKLRYNRNNSQVYIFFFVSPKNENILVCI